MIPWLKELLFSKNSFVSYVRAILLVLGMVADQGKLGLPPAWDWLGYLLMASAVFLRAGEPNAK